MCCGRSHRPVRAARGPVRCSGATRGPAGWRDWLRSGLVNQPGERVSGWAAILAGSAALSELFTAGERELSSLLQACPEIRHVVHGDLLNRNVLVEPDGSRLTAVFDWGCSVWGDFLYEAAWFTFWAPWHPGLAAIDFRSVIRGHYRAAGVEVPRFGERLRCYELHIGLTHLAYCAFAGRDREATCARSPGAPAISSARPPAAPAAPVRRIPSARYQPERLGHHQRVVADRESRITHLPAHLCRMPELLMGGPPLRHRGVSLSLAERVSQVHVGEPRVARRAVVSITATGSPAESTTTCRRPGWGNGS